MKRNKLVRYLEKNGCSFVREGNRHSLFRNVSSGNISTVPRHPDIKENLCRKICKDLGIPDILKPYSVEKAGKKSYRLKIVTAAESGLYHRVSTP